MECVLPEPLNFVQENLRAYMMTKRTYKKDWRELNSDNIKKYQKDYLEKNNIEIECGVCKGRYKKYNKKIHEASKAHKGVVEAEKNKKIIEDLQHKISLLETKLHH